MPAGGSGVHEPAPSSVPRARQAAGETDEADLLHGVIEGETNPEGIVPDTSDFAAICGARNVIRRDKGMSGDEIEFCL